jgi:hypothetical protein
MARCDELGDRREPVGLGNSVGSDADAALTFKAGHGRVVNEPLDRAAREREFDAVTELHRVNLSPENRFEASPLRGIPLPPGLYRRHLGVLVRNGRDDSMALWGVVLVGIVRVANRLRTLSAQAGLSGCSADRMPLRRHGTCQSHGARNYVGRLKGAKPGRPAGDAIDKV